MRQFAALVILLCPISGCFKPGTIRRTEKTAVRLLEADAVAHRSTAGVWGHHANCKRQMLEPGDVEEGLAAAAAIGDDTTQRRSTGRIRPESWTHGSGEQRVRLLRLGLESPDASYCG